MRHGAGDAAAEDVGVAQALLAVGAREVVDLDEAGGGVRGVALRVEYGHVGGEDVAVRGADAGEAVRDGARERERGLVGGGVHEHLGAAISRVAGVGVEREEHACAVARGDGGAFGERLVSPSRVSTTFGPSWREIRRASSRVTCFSRVLCGPRTPCGVELPAESWPPWPASRTIVDMRRAVHSPCLAYAVWAEEARDRGVPDRAR